MANTHSANFVSASSQSLSILDSSQTGLDIVGDITIEAWVKPSIGTTYAIAGKWNNADYNNAYYLQLANTGKFNFYYSDTGVWTSHNTGLYFTYDFTSLSNTWFHVAVAVDVDAKTGYLYLNGSLVETLTNSSGYATSIYNSPVRFEIGAAATNSTARYNGKMDEVRVWNDIRTAQEIADNYNTELTGSESNLQGYWKLNNSLLDSSPNGNNLTNNNGVTFTTDIPFTGEEPSTPTTNPAFLYNFI